MEIDACPLESRICANCNSIYERMRHKITEVIITKHFLRDAPAFRTDFITKCEQTPYTRLHKYEGNVDGHHIFRALKNKVHYVYAIDKSYRLVFLRAFKNFNLYQRFLGNKKLILAMIENAKS